MCRSRSVTRRLASLVSVAVITCSVGSCAQWDKSVRVERQHEAGAVHFAVLSTAPWQEFATTLQPHFEMDERMALESVIPTTQVLEEALLHLVQASVGASNSDNTITKTKTESESDGTSTTVNQEQRDPAPKDLLPESSVALFDADGPRRPSPAPLNQPVGLDPMMRYWAATALYQEVRLLNQYVEKAALRDGFVPYVVRLQVSLMPAARNEPYDAYTTFSFFTVADADEFAAETELAGVPQTLLRGGGSGAVARRTPQIIPLMTTDNLEARLHSQMIDNVQQLAGSIMFMAGQVTGAASGQDIRREQQGRVGRDLNALLTVARVSDNSLRVRLGAQQSVASEYAMVPRNHNLTVLVMVPEGSGRTLQVVAKTTMVDAQTGQPLKERTREEIEVAFQRVADKYEIEPRNLPTLLALAQNNDQRAFFQKLQQLERQSQGLAQSLWLDLVSLMIGSQYAATEFDLPDPFANHAEPEIPEQLALMIDDGRKSVIVLQGRGDVGVLELEATLQVRDASGTIPLMASELVIDSLRSDIYLEFPSLSAWDLAQNSQLLLILTVDGEAMQLPVRYKSQ